MYLFVQEKLQHFKLMKREKQPLAHIFIIFTSFTTPLSSFWADLADALKKKRPAWTDFREDEIFWQSAILKSRKRIAAFPVHNPLTTIIHRDWVTRVSFLVVFHQTREKYGFSSKLSHLFLLSRKDDWERCQAQGN